jgi:hypothetical protein
MSTVLSDHGRKTRVDVLIKIWRARRDRDAESTTQTGPGWAWEADLAHGSPILRCPCRRRVIAGRCCWQSSGADVVEKNNGSVAVRSQQKKALISHRARWHEWREIDQWSARGLAAEANESQDSPPEQDKTHLRSPTSASDRGQGCTHGCRLASRTG